MHALLQSSALLLTTVLPFAAANAQSEQDKAAIQKIVQEEQDAWNRGDAQAFAAHFAADGSFTNIVGMQTYGVEPFRKQHEAIFATIYKGSHNEFMLGRLRFIRPDVAVADVDSVLSKFATLIPGTPLGSDGAIHTRLQLVLSREQGVWQIDAFHNVVLNPAYASRPPR
jgi:uncharacterized protein (TIGR02246 family)